jgi:hypothetical protein
VATLARCGAVDIDGAASGESRRRSMTKTPKYFTPSKTAHPRAGRPPLLKSQSLTENTHHSQSNANNGPMMM